VYDPRKGFRQAGTPDLQSKYTCYSQLGSTHLMYPISRQQEIRSNLYYGSKSSGENRKSIRCDVEAPYQNMELDILVGKCDSIIECDLKFSPMPPLVGFNDGLINEDVEIFRSYNKNSGIIPAYVKVGGREEDAFVKELPVNPEKLSKSWILYLDFATDVAKITCHAQWASSGLSISAEIDTNSKLENSGIESGVGNSKLNFK
ncbi:unnamed protein product, partial [Allacma fusca]